MSMTASVSLARLHGEACWHCGAVSTRLWSAGEVTLEIAPGKSVTWPTKACAEHLQSEEVASGA
jgi:hypothetical protein